MDLSAAGAGGDLTSVTIEPITRASAAAYRAARLEALRESPEAFGSTHAEESLLSQRDWEERADGWTADGATGFLAREAGRTCGLVAAFIEPGHPETAHLVSLWVAPSHRRAGVGRRLVDRVVCWAQGRNARIVRLTVTSSNAAAIAFYERLDFCRTGRTEPYPNDPSLVELEMIRALDVHGADAPIR